MLFHSPEFAVLFALVLLLLALNRRRVRQLTLLLASYVFYMWFSIPLLGLLLFSTLLDYGIGRAMRRSEDPTRRKILVGLSLAGNLGVLFVFKYSGWLLDSANSLAQILTDAAPFPHYDLILPLGISFYTFQTLSYAIDVYRRDLEPAESFLDFATFVAFFPQLVAGPIVRARSLLPQLERGPHYEKHQVRRGIGLFVFGLVKKLCVADALSPIVFEAFLAPESVGSVHLLLGVYAFALQIYCDFSGYTDMARGIGFLLGYDVGLNFSQPYLSASVREFWRRWHISLSTWLRDYLYISLGGNRCSTPRRILNVMLTMLLGGLWHGANWTFVVWGALHGVWIAVETLARRSVDPAPGRWAVRAAQVLLTFHGVCLTWIFFRARSLSEALNYVGGLLSFEHSPHPPTEVLIYLAAIFACDVLCRIDRVRSRLLESPWCFWTAVWIGLALVLLLSNPRGDDFVYFQF